MLIIFSPALAFFAGRTFLKYQELRLQSRQLGDGREGSATLQRLEALEAENRDLKARIETLETIATSAGVGLEGAQKLRELEAQIKK